MHSHLSPLAAQTPGRQIESMSVLLTSHCTPHLVSPSLDVCRFVVVSHTAACGRDGAKASVSRVPDGEEVGQQICLFSQMTTAGFTHSLVKPTSLQRYHRLKPNAVNHRNEISLMSWLFLQRESWIISHVSPLEFLEESQQCFKLCPDLQSALNDLSCSTHSFYCLLDEKWCILGFFLTQFT